MHLECSPFFVFNFKYFFHYASNHRNEILERMMRQNEHADQKLIIIKKNIKFIIHLNKMQRKNNNILSFKQK